MNRYFKNKEVLEAYWLVLVVAAFCLIPIVCRESTVMLLTEIFSLILFAVSINFLLGYTGMIPFGHAAFMGQGFIVLQSC